MGTIRRDSQQIRAVRDAASAEERADLRTLVPCPACDGSGLRPVQEVGGRYRAGRCAWCAGHGCVDAKVLRVFSRWLRIKVANRRRCAERR